MAKQGELKLANIKSEVFSPWLLWIYSLQGFIFSEDDPSILLKLFIAFLIHAAYIWNFLLGLIHLDVYAEKQTIDALITKTCRTMELLITFSKLLWYLWHSRKLKQALSDLSILNQTVRKKYINPSDKIHGFWISFVLIFIIVRLVWMEPLLAESTKNFHWIVPVIKDALEFEFMISLLSKIRQLFFILNDQMMRNYYHAVNINKLMTIAEDVIDDDLKINDLRERVKVIRNVSLLHHNLASLSSDLNRVLSFSVALLLMKNIADVVHEFHHLFLIVTEILEVRNFMSTLSWFLYTSALTIFILHIWTSLIKEANKTPIILHDIWNIYSKCKIHGKLLYFQYISMRLLTSKLKLTAHGFFPIDRTFLHTILAATATYVIILIQLKK